MPDKPLLSGRRPPPRSFLALATSLLLLAAVTRLWRLADVPPGVARDETLNADIATFILSGRLALFFREGYGHEPLYHYLAAGFMPLLGDNLLTMRLPSVMIGLLLIAVVLAWARRAFGPLPALVAGGLLAVSWWPIIFSRIGLRPQLSALLVALAVWQWRRPWVAGTGLALALYTYTAARLTPLLPAVFALYTLLLGRGWSGDTSRPFRRAVRTTLISTVLGLPLFLVLRAEPGLQERVNQLSGPLDALWAGDWRPVWTSVRVTMGVFSFGGDPLWSYALPGRPLFDWFSALFFYGGLILALRRSVRFPVYGLTLIWLGLGLLPSALAPDAPSLIRLILIQPVVYVMPGLAVTWLSEQAAERLPTRVNGPALTSALVVLVLGLWSLNAWRSWQDGYRTWASAPEVRQKYQSIWLDISRDLRASGALDVEMPIVVADSWYEPVKADSLRRLLGRPLPARWVRQGNALVLPAGAGRLYVPEFAPLHPALLAHAGLGEPLYRSQNRPGFAVYALPAAPPSLPATLDLPFAAAGRAHLLALRGQVLLTGEDPGLLSYWQVLAPLPADLAAFVHLIDSAGQIAGQYDGLDAMPGTLRPGDRFLQWHPLSAPGPGPYTLQLGLYQLVSGERLTHPGQPADRALLYQDLAWPLN